MKFTRSSGNRFYKRLFLVGVEGTRTECDYFTTVFTLCEAIRKVDTEEEAKMIADLSEGK